MYFHSYREAFVFERTRAVRGFIVAEASFPRGQNPREWLRYTGRVGLSRANRKQGEPELSELHSAGTGTGELNFTAGRIRPKPRPKLQRYVIPLKIFRPFPAKLLRNHHKKVITVHNSPYESNKQPHISEQTSFPSSLFALAYFQVMLYVDGMGGVMNNTQTIQWLYSLIASKYRLVVKTALKLLLVFVEYSQNNCYLLVSAIGAVDNGRGTLAWTNIMK